MDNIFNKFNDVSDISNSEGIDINLSSSGISERTIEHIGVENQVSFGNIIDYSNLGELSPTNETVLSYFKSMFNITGAQNTLDSSNIVNPKIDLEYKWTTSVNKNSNNLPIRDTGELWNYDSFFIGVPVSKDDNYYTAQPIAIDDLYSRERFSFRSR